MNNTSNINITLNKSKDKKKIELLINDPIDTTSYIDLQRKLMHMEYNSSNISMIDAIHYENKFIEFKNDIKCKCENNNHIRNIIERSVNTPAKLYQFVEIDLIYNKN